MKLIANEPGAQLISEKAHMKELKKLAMAHNIEELLLWKAEVDSSHRRLKTSSVTGQRIRSKFIFNFKAHQLKDIRNLKTIKEGDGAAHLGRAAEDAQIYSDGIREDGHVYAQLYGIPIDEVSKYFRKLPLLPNSYNQNMQLTEFNRSLALHAVGGPSWLPWQPLELSIMTILRISKGS